MKFRSNSSIQDFYALDGKFLMPNADVTDSEGRYGVWRRMRRLITIFTLQLQVSCTKQNVGHMSHTILKSIQRNKLLQESLDFVAWNTIRQQQVRNENLRWLRQWTIPYRNWIYRASPTFASLQENNLSPLASHDSWIMFAMNLLHFRARTCSPLAIINISFLAFNWRTNCLLSGQILSCCQFIFFLRAQSKFGGWARRFF
jgi:hypothetical protein